MCRRFLADPRRRRDSALLGQPGCRPEPLSRRFATLARGIERADGVAVALVIERDDALVAALDPLVEPLDPAVVRLDDLPAFVGPDLETADRTVRTAADDEGTGDGGADEDLPSRDRVSPVRTDRL